MTTSHLRRLFDEIIAEAERRPEFGRHLAAAISDATPKTPQPPRQPPKGARRNRRAPAVLDPFELFGRGEVVLRDALHKLTLDQLKDIVSEQAMDSSKLALKWRSSDRLIDLIATTVRARIEKGDAFKRNFGNQSTTE